MKTRCAIREDFPSNTRSDSTLDTRAFSTGHGLRCIIFIHTTIAIIVHTITGIIRLRWGNQGCTFVYQSTIYADLLTFSGASSGSAGGA
jgi:hypothetical protein